MESVAKALVEILKQLLVRLMCDNLKENMSSQIYMAELAFATNYTLLENY